MTDVEPSVADVLAQVVEIGPTAHEADLGAAVSRHVAGRSGPRGGGSPDPATVAALHAARNMRPDLAAVSTVELLDELRARYVAAGLAPGGPT
jgi:hypothetical protein